MTADDLRAMRKMVDDDLWKRGRAYNLTGDRETTMLMERAYDGSLDAAKELHGALLPGWVWLCEETVDGHLARVEKPIGVRMYSAVSFDGNPARAWLLAILDALIAKEQSETKP